MNIVQILNRVSIYASQLKFVNTVYKGDIYENLNGHQDTKYGVVNIDIPSVSVNDNLQVMNIYLYYCDRLTQDNTNEYEIKATAELVLTSIINYLSEIGDVYDGYQINFFNQTFTDNLAGGYVQIQFETDRILGDCLIDEYKDEPSAILYIVENGEYDTTNYKKVIVNVPSVTTEEITQKEYDALTEYDPYKIYLITE